MKRIIPILVVLIVILLALSWWQRKATVAQDVDLMIHTSQGMHGVQYQQLQALPTSQVPTNRGDTLKLIRMQDLLEALDISWHGITSVTLTSEDGGSLTVDAAELPKLYLQMNQKAESQYLRLVIPSDEFAQRWLKYITTITLNQ